MKKITGLIMALVALTVLVSSPATAQENNSGLAMTMEASTSQDWLGFNVMKLTKDSPVGLWTKVNYNPEFDHYSYGAGVTKHIYKDLYGYAGTGILKHKMVWSVSEFNQIGLVGVLDGLVMTVGYDTNVEWVFGAGGLF